jgi:hypothetical protein
MSRPNATAISSKDPPIEGQVYIHRQAGQNQFVWKRVPIYPKTGKPYPLSHEVGKRGGSRVAELKYARENQ